MTKRTQYGILVVCLLLLATVLWAEDTGGLGRDLGPLVMAISTLVAALASGIVSILTAVRGTPMERAEARRAEREEREERERAEREEREREREERARAEREEREERAKE